MAPPANPDGWTEVDAEVAHVIRGRADAGLALLCDHASNALPSSYPWPEEDRWIVDTHWAWDPGAALLTKELAAQLQAPAVLAGFSRLLVDPNRPEDSTGLIRTEAEGKLIALNGHGNDAGSERERRVRRFHRGYHAVADRLAAWTQGPVLLSIHTFTPVYEGVQREMEVGVLWERDDAFNEQVAARFEAAGFVAGRNEPYSGKAGLTYAVERHAQRHGHIAVELEVRQDLVSDPLFRERVRSVVAGVIGALPG